MSEQPLSGRAEGESRLDIHNTNVDQDRAEAGLCGTVDLRSGSVCLRQSLHPDGCEFESPNGSGASGP